MKLSDYRNDYYFFSGKASEIARQLSLAGIAVIWIFKAEKAGALAVPQALHLPAVLFIVALALDLLQYVIGTAIWGTFSRYHEWKGLKDEVELEAPRFFNWPGLFFFWGKLVAVLYAYAALFRYIYNFRQVSSTFL